MTKRPTTRKKPTELKVKGGWLAFHELYNFWCFKTAIKLELELSDLESLMTHDYLSYRQETISVSSILFFSLYIPIGIGFDFGSKLEH